MKKRSKRYKTILKLDLNYDTFDEEKLRLIVKDAYSGGTINLTDEK